MKRKSHTKVRRVTVHKPMKSHRRKRKSHGLSAGKTQLTSSLMASGGGAVGGYLASMVNGMLPDKIGTIGRIAIGIGFGVVSQQFLNAPNVGSGIVGGMLALNNPTKGLGEFAEDDALSEEPLYLSEMGEELTLGEDGNYYYA